MTDKTRGILLVPGFVLCLLAVTVTAAGCGGSGSDLQQFVGTWMYTQSQGTLACQGSDPLTGTLGSSTKWGLGLSSDLVDLDPELFDTRTQCFYQFDVKDKVATIQPTQKCSFDDGSGTGSQVEEDPSSWTFTLTSATTADETFMTTIATTCTFSGQATLKKVSASN